MSDEPTPQAGAPEEGIPATPPTGAGGGALEPPDAPPVTFAPGAEGTRKRLSWWDHVKFLVVFAGVFWLLVWASMADNPLVPYRDALNDTLRRKWWLVALFAIEVVRQLHYLVAERSAPYHRLWVRAFADLERRVGRMNDWNRYRLARAFKVALALALADVLLAAAFHVSPATAMFELPKTIWKAMPFAIQLLFYFFLLIFQFIGLFWFLSRGGMEVYFPEDIKTRFSDVWGQDRVLERVKENIVYLEEPEKIEEKGGYVPGGILLWGPPGTGKTLMAEAVAGETGKPFVFVDPGAFINMFFGVGILKVKALFRKLRRLALRYGGVIVFFDEADSLGNRGALLPGEWGPGMASTLFSDRPPCNGLSYLTSDTASLLFRSALGAGSSSGGGGGPRGSLRDRVIMGGMGGGGMGTLQALLTELSGLKKPRGFVNRVVRRVLGMRPKPPPKYRILVMMATNMPQALDEALLRPGRIDRIYKVGYPSKEGRKRTYEGYLSKVRHSLTPEEIDKIATITPYSTGATIKDMVNEALINAIREGRESIVWRDMIKAKQLKELGPPEDVEYIERERHAVAVHEACHAVAAHRVRRHLTIDIATIEKGGTYLGMVASIPPEEQFTGWRSEYDADIMVSLASLAGESLFFDGDSSSGVSGDLEAATQVAILMEGYWGMGQTVASHGVTHRVGIVGGGRPGAGDQDEKELLRGTLGHRIESKLEELLERTKALLAESRREILAVAHALETHKTITGDDVAAIIEGREGPLVDGRVYQDPGFLEAAEAYHARVLAAHREHAKVEVPLPVLAPVAREPVATVATDGPVPEGAGLPWLAAGPEGDGG